MSDAVPRSTAPPASAIDSAAYHERTVRRWDARNRLQAPTLHALVAAISSYVEARESGKRF